MELDDFLPLALDAEFMKASCPVSLSIQERDSNYLTRLKKQLDEI